MTAVGLQAGVATQSKCARECSGRFVSLSSGGGGDGRRFEWFSSHRSEARALTIADYELSRQRGGRRLQPTPPPPPPSVAASVDVTRRAAHRHRRHRRCYSQG